MERFGWAHGENFRLSKAKRVRTKEFKKTNKLVILKKNLSNFRREKTGSTIYMTRSWYCKDERTENKWLKFSQANFSFFCLSHTFDLRHSILNNFFLNLHHILSLFLLDSIIFNKYEITTNANYFSYKVSVAMENVWGKISLLDYTMKSLF